MGAQSTKRRARRMQETPMLGQALILQREHDVRRSLLCSKGKGYQKVRVPARMRRRLGCWCKVLTGS
eukprot:1729760-Rhodomonas_salina.1